MGSDALQMMSFKLSDGSLVEPSGIDLSGCLDNTYHDLTGRIIGFVTKEISTPVVGDGYSIVRSIQPILNTNDCVVTRWSPDTLVPDKECFQGDPQVTFQLPPTTNSLQVAFGGRITC